MLWLGCSLPWESLGIKSSVDEWLINDKGLSVNVNVFHRGMLMGATLKHRRGSTKLLRNFISKPMYYCLRCRSSFHPEKQNICTGEASVWHFGRHSFFSRFIWGVIHVGDRGSYQTLWLGCLIWLRITVWLHSIPIPNIHIQQPFLRPSDTVGLPSSTWDPPRERQREERRGWWPLCTQTSP